MTRTQTPAASGGPFRLLKYFIISGFAVIALVTFLLGAFLYTTNVDALRQSSGSYARLLAENLNYNIYVGFYGPLKARGLQLDLRKWDQFGTLDSLVKDFTYGLKIQRIKIVDRQRKIVYSTEYDLIGKYEPGNPDVEEALSGKDVTAIHYEKRSPEHWYGNWLVESYYPLREGAGNYWMLGNIYGVIQITQDVTDQYFSVQRSIFVVILVAAGLMAFSFVMLTLIVRRGERILLERAREQKKLEEQLQQSEKLASIGQMVATLAHEIRNPLGIIRSSAEVLVKKANPDPLRVQKLCGIIVEEARRLSEILTDFLDFAKPRSPASRSIDVRDVVQRVRNNLDQQIKSKHINWIEESANGEIPVSADPDLLYQAFLNVAINAFEAMEEGGAFSVTVERQGAEVTISFADTGHGIKDEDLSKIFTPFFTTHEMGTGLGLSVVHNIITAHGGEIEVESHLGRGAIFTITLPAGSAAPGGREISTKVPS
jgi:two-component system, NtrC family, sensor histidine kinase HydH